MEAGRFQEEELNPWVTHPVTKPALFCKYPVPGIQQLFLFFAVMENAATNPLKDQPVYFIGFMGSGKTHWGRMLAAQLQRKFVDLDQLIEQNEQLSVQQIFEKNGEDWFREKEALSLRSLMEEENVLISCGGGTPCFHDNMRFMNETGTTIFLEASPKFLLQNIIKEPDARPLLKNMNEAEMLFFIEKKLEERNSFYQQATIICNAETLTEQSLQTIIRDHHA